MFDEYLNPPPCVDPQVPAVITPELVVSIGLPSSTTIDQDAPPKSTSQTPPKTPSPVIPLDVEKADHDIEVAYMDNNPFVEFPIPEPRSEEFSTLVVIPNHVHSINQPPEHINKWTKDHSIDNVISDPSRPVSTRQQLQDKALLCYFDAFLSSVEPKSYKDALTKFVGLKPCKKNSTSLNDLKFGSSYLVPLCNGCYLEVDLQVARLEAIRIFIAFTAHMNMVVYQMAVNIAFMNDILREEVYVSQPDGFVNPENPNHVYKLKKALYGLKQAPRAWYDLLSSFLLSQKFTKGTVDPALFVRREGKDILLVQIYADDIIFASTKPGLQISQSPRGIFLNQSKYSLESIKKYGIETCEPADTSMVEKSKADEDPQGKAVDPTRYRGMIDTLMYLTASRPDLVFVVCMCARYQAKPTKNHLHATLTMRVAKILEKIPLYYDNKSVIALCCNNVQHSRSKHIDIRHHFIKEQVENRVVELYFVRTEYQLADIFTKPLARERLEFLIKKLGMQSMSPETLKKLADEEEE
ncbi:retrovirus-related pol polyprotein from transposon TNT 1-94 [Tanacetum coccineum]